MNLLFTFPEPVSFLNNVPWWGWALAGGILLLIIIIIIAAAVSKSKKKKKAKESASVPVQEQAVEDRPIAEEVLEEQPQPVAEEISEEPAQEEAPQEEKKPANKTQTKKQPVVTPVKKTATAKKTTTTSTAKKPATPAKKTAAAAADKPASKVYHISKRKEDNRWQIKAEGGAKAIKLFNTQKEAIEYCKTLAGNQEARIMIHKEDGSFRKLTY